MSLRNTIRKRAYKERAQPHSRRKFGLLEKHKDYVERARAYQQKKQTLQRLKEKAAFKNPDEFNFKMIRSKCVNGVHKQWNPQRNESNKKNKEKFTLMKRQKRPTDKKKIGRLNGVLNWLDNQSSDIPLFYAKDRKMTSYREWQARQDRKEEELEEIYMNMSMQKELRKKGMKRKLREDELVCSTSRSVYI
ncbi:hypothetical protein CDL12_07409 [Handroanthus impetiginosus]|uniref:U3 small nucleolar RNA-associated protein 11 n=1 Tax=Handroanthus impetiginosus TaxID=429701 RepID=A0A2G9HQV5_9LAMI|nr:hypothetical protein CDL12_07409 [Handroanthus impetiginosus]